MDHMRILKRAWSILWSYRALWVLGFLLALTSGSFNGGGGNNSVQNNGRPSGNPNFRLPPGVEQEFRKLGEWLTQVFSPQNLPNLMGVLIGVVIFFLLLGVLFTLVRYVAETSVIRMVNEYEDTGERRSWRTGWRLGWSRSAWRLFLTDLLLFLPLVATFVILFGCAALPVLLNVLAGNQPGTGSVVATVGLAFLVIFLAILVGIALSLAIQIVHRKVVLGELGPVEAIREGWLTVRRRFKDVGLMWLILLGVRIGFGLASFIAALLLLAAAVLAGGGTGLLLYLIAQAVSGVTAGWVTAAIGGGLIFVLVFGIPMTFLSGLGLVYSSSAWTLTYRELNALPVG